MMIWTRFAACFAVACVCLVSDLPAQQSGGQSGGQGGSQGSGNQYCPHAYLFSTDDIHYYRMKKCAQNSYAYEGFGESVSPLGCNANSSCKCGCLPNTHNPALVDQTTSFTEQAGASDIEYGAADDLPNQRSLKVTFPDVMEPQFFRIVRVQVEETSTWTWIGLPTEDEGLKAKAIDAMMATQSATGNPRAWAVGFDSGAGFKTAWVMRRE